RSAPRGREGGGGRGGRGGPWPVLYAQADPLAAGSPFGIAGQLVRRGAGLSMADADRTPLDAHLAEIDAAGATDALAEIAGLAGARAPIGPLAHGDRLRVAFEDWLAAECALRPVILSIDDLHWGDAVSVQLL